jgi:UDP-N-acetylmuramoyl-tripeptide--D-alanyl-D-alanine ligase
VRLPAGELAKLPHKEFRNHDVLRHAVITGVSTDTRTLRQGDLFVALRGTAFDGHEFVAQAFAAGAVAAIVDNSSQLQGGITGALLIVEDTARALGELARLYRTGFKIPVVAIAGSNGKTTTKDMIARILHARYTVLSTEGNLNNHIGVPHTLFRLNTKHEIAVVEIGTNHPGEIAQLCSILEPTHGVITNVGKEHLEYFRTVERVALEEGSLFAALRKRKRSVAFVNMDDPLIASQAKDLRAKVSYGMTHARADVRGTIVRYDRAGCARVQIRAKGRKTPISVRLQVPGESQAANALAAATVGLTFGVSAGRIRRALESFAASSKRMEVIRVNGVTVFNDTYNANPDSTLAALRVLARAAGKGKKIAVLSDMLELGARGVEEHLRVGKTAAALGIDFLLTYGTLARQIHDGSRMMQAIHYENKNVLAEYLAELVRPGDLVLVKGSRGMKMEDVVTFLQERLRPGTSGER